MCLVCIHTKKRWRRGEKSENSGLDWSLLMWHLYTRTTAFLFITWRHICLRKATFNVLNWLERNYARISAQNEKNEARPLWATGRWGYEWRLRKGLGEGHLKVISFRRGKWPETAWMNLKNTQEEIRRPRQSHTYSEFNKEWVTRNETMNLNCMKKYLLALWRYCQLKFPTNKQNEKISYQKDCFHFIFAFIFKGKNI